MEKIKIKDIKTGAIKEVKKSLAGEFVGTGRFVLVNDKEVKPTPTTFTTKANK